MRAQAVSIARFLAIFGLLLHVAVPMVHPPPQAAAAPALATHDATGHSATGHHGGHGDTAGLGGNHAPEPKKRGHDRPMPCPICQALQLGGTALLPSSPVLLPPDRGTVAFEAAAAEIALHRFALPLQPRAPPLLG